jgi:hypothetical protein
MTSRDLAGLRARYLFQLARLCSLRPPDVEVLDLADFAGFIDSIDSWLKIEFSPRR